MAENGLEIAHTIVESLEEKKLVQRIHELVRQHGEHVGAVTAAR